MMQKKRWLYSNKIRHNMKLYKSGDLMEETANLLKELYKQSEMFKRKNQYE